MATDRLLQRRKRFVKISKMETILILRSYQAHPTSWSDVLSLEQLPEDAKALYQAGTLRKLKDRMSGKFGKLMSTLIHAINDADSMYEVSKIKTAERRLLQRKEPNLQVASQIGERREGNHPPQPGPSVNRRDAIVANLSDPDEEENIDSDRPDEEPVEQPQVNQSRQRKRPLSALIRKNHEEYNKFITKKMPRLFRA